MSETEIKNLRLTSWPDPPAIAGSDVSRLDYISGHDELSDWAVVIPGKPSGDLMVILHGHGSHGDQILERPIIRDRWIPALRSAGLNVLCPNLRDNAWMSPAAVQDLHALILWAKGKFQPRRIFISGGSMGGTSALIYAAIHPQSISGVLSLCPAADLPEYWRWTARTTTLSGITDAIVSSYGATPDQNPELFARHSALVRRHRLTMPIALAHGSADLVIGIEPVRELARKLKDQTSVRYLELPDGDHDSPLPLFPELLEWLLKIS